MMDYVVKKLETLLKIPSPTGNTEKAIEFMENEFQGSWHSDKTKY